MDTEKKFPFDDDEGKNRFHGLMTRVVSYLVSFAESLERVLGEDMIYGYLSKM